VQGKSFDIPKQLIWAAWLKVKQNGGAAGADGVTIEQFEQDLKNNLYRLWNRMSSGSYFPGPVRAVEIPKKGGTRILGIPNVIDRVAQTAAVLLMVPGVEKVFHDDSYGYRPGRSPAHAVRVCRQRCFQRDWVLAAIDLEDGGVTDLGYVSGVEKPRPVVVGRGVGVRVVVGVVSLSW
jgi:retron-type reverse transcriptase